MMLVWVGMGVRVRMRVKGSTDDTVVLNVIVIVVVVVGVRGLIGHRHVIVVLLQRLPLVFVVVGLATRV
jgi:hypothetical protein